MKSIRVRGGGHDDARCLECILAPAELLFCLSATTVVTVAAEATAKQVFGWEVTLWRLAQDKISASPLFFLKNNVAYMCQR